MSVLTDPPKRPRYLGFGLVFLNLVLTLLGAEKTHSSLIVVLLAAGGTWLIADCTPPDICHAADFSTVRRFQGKDLTSDFIVSAQFNRCYSAGFKLLKTALQSERRYDKAFPWPAMFCDWLE